MFKKTTTQFLSAASLVALTGTSSVSHSIEEPDFQLLDRIDSVEIRHYQPTIQAVTQLAGPSNSSEGFRRLAGFIFGGNQTSEKIAMTAPVQETIGVSQPVMAFSMPGEYTMEDLPQPLDDRVTLHKVPGKTVAVVMFSGWATEGAVDKHEALLRQTLQSSDINAIGTATLNQYNPPWTLPFLRRNEIMIEVSASLYTSPTPSLSGS